MENFTDSPVEPQNEKTPLFVLILIYGFFATLLAVAACLVMSYFFGTFEAWVNSTPEMCQTDLPKGYKVVYNAETKEYAAKSGNEYLRCSFHGHYDTSNWAEFAATFSDSCRAKIFAFDFIRDKAKAEKLEKGFK